MKVKQKSDMKVNLNNCSLYTTITSNNSSL